MSLVACVTNYGMPLIISDFAISTFDECKPIEIPIINKKYADEDFNGELKIEGYHIKTIIVKDKICAGFTGQFHQIRNAIRFVIDYFLYRDVTPENFSALIEEMDYSKNFPGTSAIFLMGRPDIAPMSGMLIKFGTWKSELHPTYDQMFTSGTGAEEWHQCFTQQSSYQDQGKEIYIREILHKALLTAMYFLKEELTGPVNLRNGWGGGFDLIYYESGNFKRLQKVSFVFWTVNIAEAEWVFYPKTILMYSYVGENLFIHNFNGELRTYCIQPIVNISSTSEVPDIINYSSSMLTSHISIFNGEAEVSSIIVVDGTMVGDEIFHTKDINGNLSFGVDIRVQDRWVKIIKSVV